jgi:hypothetical protein
VIEPIREETFDLDDLVAGITDENRASSCLMPVMWCGWSSIRRPAMNSLVTVPQWSSVRRITTVGDLELRQVRAKLRALIVA